MFEWRGMQDAANLSCAFVTYYRISSGWVSGKSESRDLVLRNKEVSKKLFDIFLITLQQIELVGKWVARAFRRVLSRIVCRFAAGGQRRGDSLVTTGYCANGQSAAREGYAKALNNKHFKETSQGWTSLTFVGFVFIQTMSDELELNLNWFHDALVLFGWFVSRMLYGMYSIWF